MNLKLNHEKVKLYQMSNLKFKKKFDIFYKFRFHSDYLINNINKKKISKKKSKIWFKKNQKKNKLFDIKIKKKIVGLIIYNLINQFYSIIILNKYRNKGIGTFVLLKFITFLKKKKMLLSTLVKKNNKKSLYIHKKICKYYRSKNKLFYYFKII